MQVVPAQLLGLLPNTHPEELLQLSCYQPHHRPQRQLSEGDCIYERLQL
jgi:hypothetical protein